MERNGAIDPVEVEEALECLAGEGRDPKGGVSRLAYTDAWRGAMERVRAWLESAGMNVRWDAAGNLMGRIPGPDRGSVVATGSHIDSVVNGGKYDGAAGVVAGLFALRSLHREHGSPSRPVELIVICDEESSRFPSNFFGSRAIAGRVSVDETTSLVDGEGVVLADAMRDCGFEPLEIESAARDDIDVFIELHIEQGPVLERSGATLGIVDAITGSFYADHRLEGRSDHAGTTPMADRRDPVVGFAEMVLAVESLMGEQQAGSGRGTVGRVAAFPGAANVIARHVDFTTDLRDPDPDRFEALVHAAREAMQEIAERRHLVLSSQTRIHERPVTLDEDVVSTVRAAAERIGVPSLEMASGAGHDTMVLAEHGARTAMLFVPSRGGSSHSPTEYSSPAHIALGAEVLAEAIHGYAY